MSNVTDVILTFSGMEDHITDEDDNWTFPIADQINDYLFENCSQKLSQDISQIEPTVAGGRGPFTKPVFLAAINYLDLNGLIAFLLQIEWEYPEEVVLIVEPEQQSSVIIQLAYTSKKDEQ